MSHSHQIILSFLACLLPLESLSLPLFHLPRSSNGPVINTNFQDPSLFNDQGVWYSFSGPNGNPGVNVQVAYSTDFSSWTVATGYDALPTLGAWAANPGHLWSPDVNQLPSGSYIMYYSASSASSPSHHCIGAATATDIHGPYTPYDEPLTCDLSTGGSIDPDGFIDPLSNNLFLVYKVDGNSMGNGGSCSNDVAPIIPTPIMLQQVSSVDGYTVVGEPVQLISNDPSDGPDIEAPALFYDASTALYVLMYSSGCFTSSSYTIKYATSSSLTGPYTKSSIPLLSTGMTAAAVNLPGAIDVARYGSSDGTGASGGVGTKVIFHGDTNMGWFSGQGARVRAMFAAELAVVNPSSNEGPSVTISGLF